jgi:cytochrome c5
LSIFYRSLPVNKQSGSPLLIPRLHMKIISAPALCNRIFSVTRCRVGGPGLFRRTYIVQAHNVNTSLYRRGTLLIGPVIAPILFLAFAVSVGPSKTFAQNQPDAQKPAPATTAPSSPSQPKPAVELPEGDGKAIATEYCQDCHKLTNLTAARKTSDDWHDTVQTMMDRGARLPQDKFDILVQYLVKNFGPQSAAPAAGTPSAAAPQSGSAQPPKSAELPEGDGKAIATEFCQDCHKLSNLTAARKAPDDWHDTVQTMMDRGARLPQDKVDILVAYLAKNFGPKGAAPSSGNGSIGDKSSPASPSSH